MSGCGAGIRGDVAIARARNHRPALESASGSPLPRHIERILVITKGDKTAVPKVIVRGPFHELELPDERRTKPETLFHLLCGQSLAPATALGLRKIREWTLADFKALELAEQFLA